MKTRATVALIVAVSLLGGCSVKRMAVRSLGDALAAGGQSWSSDDDPELVRDATPFALKTIESLLETEPEHRGLLLAAASGFTQYAYAFVEAEADIVESDDLERALALRERSRRLYRRALGYGLRGLGAGRPGFEAALRRDPEAALSGFDRADVPMLYWTAAAWGALVSLSKDRGDVTADLPLAAALARRALTLEPSWGAGAIHDFFIAYEGGRPAAAGGSIARAREHLERAMALAGGRRAAPLVSFAETVSVGAQDRAEFVRLLEQALAIDADSTPDLRLANIIAQRRARWLLGRADELFIE